MYEVLRKIQAIGVVPVIRIEDANKAVPLAKALKEGGIPCAEVTLRTPQALAAIASVAKEVPDILLGAGTVLSTEQVDDAVAAGAKFIVSPGFNPAVIKHCIEKGIPVTPGCATPGEMEQAIELGLDVVKFFPAEQSGGLAFLRAVSGPYSGLKYMPTGGISAANLNAYLAFDKVLACGGSWMVKPELIANEKYDEITAMCRQAVLAMLDFHLAHIGINTENTQEAMQTAQWFEILFGFAAKEGNSSIFASDCVEAMKESYLGKNGHIAIGTASVLRAKSYLEARGYRFREETAKQNADGTTIAIYLEVEVAGFAVHLVQHQK